MQITSSPGTIEMQSIAAAWVIGAQSPGSSGRAGLDCNRIVVHCGSGNECTIQNPVSRRQSGQHVHRLEPVRWVLFSTFSVSGCHKKSEKHIGVFLSLSVGINIEQHLSVWNFAFCEGPDATISVQRALLQRLKV